MSYSNAAPVLENETTTHAARVAGRFCGPPGSGNGGYTVGMIGKRLGQEVEVTLKRSVPVDETMQVVADPAGVAALLHGDTEIASARVVELDLNVPEAITFSQAAAARANYLGYQNHPFPNCYVCGPDRCCGEGMCLFTGTVGNGMVASSWVPTAEYVNEEGVVGAEFICAALDCPGAWALIGRYQIDGPVVLGRMTYRLAKPIYAGERYVIMGWARGREGRKSFCGTAVYDAEGVVCAVAGATWFQIG
jgi:hypothetical protein